MKEEIKKILQDYMLTDMPLNDATQRVLDLFAVMQRSEQLIAFFDWLNKQGNITNMYTDKYMYIEMYLKSN